MRKSFWDESGDHDNDYDPEYVATRDRESRKEIRDLVDSLWPRYEPYCGDSSFPDRVKREFVQLTWQMYVGVCLLEIGLKLERAGSEGPDHKILLENGPVWVECIAASVGKDGNAAMRTYGNANQQGSFRPPPDDKLEPRITAPIGQKWKQHNVWVEKGLISADDPYAIAVYTGTIPDADLEMIHPRIVKLLYGLDGIAWRCEIGGDGEIETIPTYRDNIERPGKAPISRRPFLNSVLPEVSAVIVSNGGVMRPARAVGRDLITVHNPTSTRLIPRGLIKLGREYWATDVVEHTDHRKPLPEPEIPPELLDVVDEARREGLRRDEEECERDQAHYEQAED